MSNQNRWMRLWTVGFHHAVGELRLFDVGSHQLVGERVVAQKA